MNHYQNRTLDRRDFIRACSAGLGLGMLAGRPAMAAPSRQRPNIILFLVDDMGWQDTSVPFWEKETPFNRHYRTPNMERLARQGVCFTQAYAHTVCSPTRTSIMTGWNPARHHVTNWTLNPDQDTSKGWSPRNWNLRGLQPDHITLPKLLRDAGYMTIHCGKAHWGARGTSGEDPKNLGFDVNIAGHAAGAPGSYQGLQDFGNAPENENRRPWAVPGLEAYHGQDIHLSDALTLEASAALEQAVAAEKPFYLYMAHYAVHTPIEPHNRFVEHYEGRNYPETDIGIPIQEAQYASMVEGMDASLGALLDKVETLDVAESTLVIFTSDNGGLSAHGRGTSPRGTELNTHNWPLRAGKGSAYEGGIRVPLIAAWAKPCKDNAFQQQLQIPQGAQSKHPVISEDLFPTLLGIGEACDGLPEAYPLDGQDFRHHLCQPQETSERPLYFHYPHEWGPQGPGYEPHSALRIGNWKVIYFYAGRRWELYNVHRDIGEEHNFAEEYPARLEHLARQLKEGLEALGAQWPVNKATGEEVGMILPGESITL